MPSARPPAPVSLYIGKVTHARLRPRRHCFGYRVISILVDLDRLEEAGTVSPLFSVNRPNLFGFHERDHGPCDGSSVRKHVDHVLKEAGLDADGVRVLLLCYPRVLGYVFNPLSLYYVLKSDGSPVALLYEVRNTFGERHVYLVPGTAIGISRDILTHELDKAFHVSPFLDGAGRYRFRTCLPGDDLLLSILHADSDGPVLATGFMGKRVEVTTANLFAAFRQVPFATLKVIVGIHWEAVRLWLKGCPIYPHPARRQPLARDADPGNRAV